MIEYTYSSGRAYELTFYDDRVTFAQLNTPAPKITLPYLARPLADQMYLVHWLVPGRIGHVSLIVDLASMRIHGSALDAGSDGTVRRRPDHLGYGRAAWVSLSFDSQKVL